MPKISTRWYSPASISEERAFREAISRSPAAVPDLFSADNDAIAALDGMDAIAAYGNGFYHHRQPSPASSLSHLPRLHFVLEYARAATLPSWPTSATPSCPRCREILALSVAHELIGTKGASPPP